MVGANPGSSARRWGVSEPHKVCWRRVAQKVAPARYSPAILALPGPNHSWTRHPVFRHPIVNSILPQTANFRSDPRRAPRHNQVPQMHYVLSMVARTEPADQDLVSQCKVCIQSRKNYPEPLQPAPLPERKWQKVGMNLMELKQQTYLIVVDYYFCYIEMAKLNSTTSCSIINHLKSIFSRHGIPGTVVSDNGPQYSCEEFSLFATSYGFTHVTLSPKHPSGKRQGRESGRNSQKPVERICAVKLQGNPARKRSQPLWDTDVSKTEN